MREGIFRVLHKRVDKVLGDKCQPGPLIPFPFPELSEHLIGFLKGVVPLLPISTVPTGKEIYAKRVCGICGIKKEEICMKAGECGAAKEGVKRIPVGIQEKHPVPVLDVLGNHIHKKRALARS